MTNLNKTPKIFITSDLHFCHDRAFVYEPRGFSNIKEMNQAIVERWNSTVQPEDIVYVLGDIMLNNNDEGIRLFNSLNGYKRIILGNHDTVTRQALYKECEKVESIELAAMLKYRGHHFFMTHYPCLTGNLEKESLKQCTLNLYGHTHQQTNFFHDLPYVYHVGVDSHNCTPVDIDTVLKEMYDKVEECKAML